MVLYVKSALRGNILTMQNTQTVYLTLFVLPLLFIIIESIVSLIIAKLHHLYTKSVDFVQAYPQAKIKTIIFLKTPPGVMLESEGEEEMVLLLLKNLYGLKNAGLTWYEHLTSD